MTTHPMFEECCLKEEDQRWCRHAPFYRDGYLCATDGRVCIRMRQEGENTPDTPPVCDSKVGWPDEKHQYESTPVILPKVSIPERTTCPDCKGNKVSQCYGCHGRGEQECPECEKLGICRDCDGTGKNECEECDADGKARATPVETIQLAKGYGLADNYIDLLNRHGAAAYLPVELKGKPTYFTVAGGIEGLVMPRSLEPNAP